MEINIIEFSSPYDMVKEDGRSTLKITYEEKRSKYAELRNNCTQKFGKHTNLFIIIVSSLGAIADDSIKDTLKLYQKMGIGKKEVETKLKRMSINALMGSYFIFYNIPFNVDDKQDDETPAKGEETDAGKHDRGAREETLEEEDEAPFIEEAEDQLFRSVLAHRRTLMTYYYSQNPMKAWRGT